MRAERRVEGANGFIGELLLEQLPVCASLIGDAVNARRGVMYYFAALV